MHVGQIIKSDCANGLGIRLSIFVSGCTNKCKGCFQPQTWDFEYGKKYDSDMEQMLIDELSKSYYQGLTILGGEPFEPSNQRELIYLIQRVKKELPEKNIWMFTGFTYDRDLVPGGSKYTEVTNQILENIDVLVDGKFVEELKDIRLKFRGSSNQRIIDVKKTLETNQVILSPLNN